MPGEAAAIERKPQVAERQVHGMPYQVMNQEGMARNSQTFLDELNDLFSLQVM
jgi:hypothetical protein